jgi:protein phosphatase
MSSKYAWGAVSDVGYSRTVNEDAVYCKDLSDDTSIFIIADGEGSITPKVQPAQIAIHEIFEIIYRVWTEDPELLANNASVFLKEAVTSANKVLSAFTIANKEMYAGFISSVSVCLLHKNELHFAHTGNTRIYLIRSHPQDGFPMIRKMTRDHTKATELLEDGIIDEFQSHVHPGRLKLTSCLGNVTSNEIHVMDTTLIPEDILLMTTGGIHYSLQPDPIARLIMESENCDTAVNALVQASIMEKYDDNMSAIMIFLIPGA